jgi:hypothetical protein
LGFLKVLLVVPRETNEEGGPIVLLFVDFGGILLCVGFGGLGGIGKNCEVGAVGCAFFGGIYLLVGFLGGLRARLQRWVRVRQL